MLSARNTPQPLNPSDTIWSTSLYTSFNHRKRIEYQISIAFSKIPQTPEVSKYLTSQSQQEQAGQESLRELLRALFHSGWTFNHLLFAKKRSQSCCKIAYRYQEMWRRTSSDDRLLPAGHMPILPANQNHESVWSVPLTQTMSHPSISNTSKKQ